MKHNYFILTLIAGALNSLSAQHPSQIPNDTMTTLENCLVYGKRWYGATKASWSGKCLNGFGEDKGALILYKNDMMRYKYEGFMKGGRFSGVGKLIGYKNGKEYRIDEGKFSNGFLVDGSIIFDDGTYYKGTLNDNGTYHGEGERGFYQIWTWGKNSKIDAFYNGTFISGALYKGVIKKKRFNDDRKEIIPETWEGGFIGAMNNEMLDGQGEHCYPCTESFILVYNWVKCWERGEFRNGKLYSGTSYEPVITRYQTGSSTGNPDYFTYTNGIKKRVENTSSSSDNSSSGSSSDNNERDNDDKKSEVHYENIEHPGVDKVDDWEEQNSLTDGRYYVTEVIFEDGINGFLYKGGSSGDYFIENSGGANYYYKNYDAALRALYVYKKYGEIIKRGAK